VWHTFYEINRASLEPWRLAARASASLFNHPLNPVAYTPMGQTARVACSAFERMIGTYGPRGFDVAELEALRRQVAAAAATGHGFSAKILPFVRPVRAAS